MYKIEEYVVTDTLTLIKDISTNLIIILFMVHIVRPLLTH